MNNQAIATGGTDLASATPPGTQVGARPGPQPGARSETQSGARRGTQPGARPATGHGLRVVLAEDGLIVREGVTVILRRFGHEVVAAVGDADELRAAVAEHDPDIVITDVRMPPTFSDEGLQAAIALRVADPDLPVLVLSQYVEQTYATELLDSGRSTSVGYLLKDRIGDVAEFVDAVVAVACGRTVVDPEVVRRLLGRRHDPVSLLTARERQVLALVAEGRSNTAIARTLSVSEAAVAKHIGSVLIKFDLPPDADDHRRVRAVLAYLRE